MASVLKGTPDNNYTEVAKSYVVNLLNYIGGAESSEELAKVLKGKSDKEYTEFTMSYFKDRSCIGGEIFPEKLAGVLNSTSDGEYIDNFGR